MHWSSPGITPSRPAEVQEIKLAVESQSPYNPIFAVDVNDPTETPFRVKFGASRIEHLRVESENEQYGIYLQDDWDVTDRLQLNLGVRYDYEETPSYLDYVTPQTGDRRA